MASTARICGFAILAFAATLTPALAKSPMAGPMPGGIMLCERPVTKPYRILPQYCAPQIAALIAQFVQGDDSCGCCGPYGIPPIYTCAQNVMVRASAETHERIAQYLKDLRVMPPVTVGTH